MSDAALNRTGKEHAVTAVWLMFCPFSLLTKWIWRLSMCVIMQRAPPRCALVHFAHKGQRPYKTSMGGVVLKNPAYQANRKDSMESMHLTCKHKAMPYFCLPWKRKNRPQQLLEWQLYWWQVAAVTVQLITNLTRSHNAAFAIFSLQRYKRMRLDALWRIINKEKCLSQT